MSIPWREEYNIGIESIDAQHKRLVLTVNKLSDAVAANESNGKVKAILLELDGYVDEHLAFEEANFAKCGYAEAEAHKTEHETFRKSLATFHKQYAGQMPLVTIEMLGYLEGWFLHHVLVTDRGYVDDFRSCGIN
jgi:hemerythrin